MNKLTSQQRVQAIACLVEGCSIRSTCRMTGLAKGTILKLLADIGCVCAEFQHEHLTGLAAERIQIDEIWAFCGAKQKHVERGAMGYGDVWTWTAIDADTKLVPCWMVGGRDAGYATEFLADLKGRLVNRVQLTTDGHKAYLEAVRDVWASDEIDYAQIIKTYGKPDDADHRYSPPQCIGCERHTISGEPDPDHVSTSYSERQNLTMRMNMRRFTRLTNGFSKKLENHFHAVALHFMHYNFCRKHQTIKTTPAMAAGKADHVWTLDEVVELLEAKERQAVESGSLKRGKYRKREDSN